MEKFICLVWCVVAVSIRSVYAAEDDDTPPEDILVLVNDCAKQNGLTMDDIKVAMNSDDISIIKPCFWGCAFTKAGFLNDQGQYDLESGLTNLKRFMKDSYGLARLEKIAKHCESVKYKAVSDGKAGCEMGTLAAACFLDLLTLDRQ